MKNAVTFSGNLRTFLMPTRENPRERICDLIARNVVEPNNADVFVFTDTNDFWYNGAQVMPENRRIEIINSNAFRLGESVKSMAHEKAHDIISQALKSVFGAHLRACEIEKPFDITQDKKYRELLAVKSTNCIPAMFAHQYRKLAKAHDLLQRHEEEMGWEYDTIVKARFDIHAPCPLSAAAYDWSKLDIITPPPRGPVIPDWFAVGKRWIMRRYMTIHERIGHTLNRPCWMWECRRCGHCVEYSSTPRQAAPVCTRCRDNARVCLYDVTLAPEHHIWRELTDSGARHADARWGTHVYRYRQNDEPLSDALERMHVAGVTLVNHAADQSISERTLP